MDAAPFRDRADAGRRLAAELTAERGGDLVVIGLPRGGVPVARVVADALGAPLDVVVVRKLGVPGHEELGFGAVSEDGVMVLNDDVVHSAGLSTRAINAAAKRERAELDRRIALIRGVHPQVPVRGRTVIVVDDGLATGIDARAACRVVRSRGAARVVIAVPVAPEGWWERLAPEADDLVAVQEPWDFAAVAQFYEEFPQVEDDEVLAALVV